MSAVAWVTDYPFIIICFLLCALALNGRMGCKQGLLGKLKQKTGLLVEEATLAPILDLWTANDCKRLQTATFSLLIEFKNNIDNRIFPT